MDFFRICLRAWWGNLAGVGEAVEMTAKNITLTYCENHDDPAKHCENCTRLLRNAVPCRSHGFTSIRPTGRLLCRHFSWRSRCGSFCGRPIQVRSNQERFEERCPVRTRHGCRCWSQRNRYLKLDRSRNGTTRCRPQHEHDDWPKRYARQSRWSGFARRRSTCRFWREYRNTKRTSLWRKPLDRIR